MGRLGLRELRAAMYPDGNVAQQPEMGVYGNWTPGEVAESRRGDDRDLEDESPRKDSVLADRVQQAKDRDDHDTREDRSMDLDRE
jgi:hypothetical protein